MLELTSVKPEVAMKISIQNACRKRVPPQRGLSMDPFLEEPSKATFIVALQGCGAAAIGVPH